MNKQWLTDGKCHICDKRQECTEPCDACTSRSEFETRCAFSRTVADEIMKGAVNSEH